MQELFWLLLPLAAASGWWTAQRSLVKKTEDSANPAYLRGLNHLVNEEPDKAIDALVELVEVDKDTVEIHLALGILFRRRGEVERAIRIHQNLIARPKLSLEQRGQALLELATDYMRAGLYDRAESLFLELKEKGLHSRKALQNLLIIYQQEKDWQAGLQIIDELEKLDQNSYCLERSHFYCELAQQALKKNQRQQAEDYLKKAQSADRQCVRPLHMQAQIHMTHGEYDPAIQCLKQAIERDLDYLPEVLKDLYQTHQALAQWQALQNYLLSLPIERAHINLTLCLTDLIRQHQGETAGIDFLKQNMQRRPHIKGLLKLIEFSPHLPAEQLKALLHQTKSQVESLLAQRPLYQCHQCGFIANTLHWQCPSCRHWSSIRRKRED